MQERIAAALVGRKIVAVRVGDPVVLRAERPVDELLVGRTLRSVVHHGKFLVFTFDGVVMTVNPMLAGIFSLQPVGGKVSKDTRMRLEFEGGTELRYRYDVRMGKVYVGMDAPGFADVEREMPPELGVKPRDHMRVRGRAGTACPRCGATLMRRRKGLDDVDLCPKCQPAPKGQLY